MTVFVLDASAAVEGPVGADVQALRDRVFVLLALLGEARADLAAVDPVTAARLDVVALHALLGRPEAPT